MLTLFNNVKYRDKQCGSISDCFSDLGQHCLLERLLKHFSRRQKQTTFVVIGVLRVSITLHASYFSGLFVICRYFSIVYVSFSLVQDKARRFSDLIWVQTVCKTNFASSRQIVRKLLNFICLFWIHTVNG